MRGKRGNEVSYGRDIGSFTYTIRLLTIILFFSTLFIV